MPLGVANYGQNVVVGSSAYTTHMQHSDKIQDETNKCAECAFVLQNTKWALSVSTHNVVSHDLVMSYPLNDKQDSFFLSKEQHANNLLTLNQTTKLPYLACRGSHFRLYICLSSCWQPPGESFSSGLTLYVTTLLCETKNSKMGQLHFCLAIFCSVEHSIVKHISYISV